MDTSEQELYSNKKQAVESAYDKPASGAANMNISLLGNTSSSQSVQIGNCLFRPKPIRISNFADKNVSLMGVLNMAKKGSEDQVEIDSSICLPGSRDEEGLLCLSIGGRNQIVSDNRVSEFVGKPSNPRDKNKIISSIIHGRIDKNFLSLGEVSNKRDDNFMLPCYLDDGIDNILPSIGQPFDKKFGNFIPAGEGFEKGNDNLMPIDPNYSGSNETFVYMDSFYNKANDAYMSAGPTFDNGRIDIASITSIQGQQDATVASLGAVYNKGNSSFLSMGQSHNKGNGTTVPFGGFHYNPVVSYPSFRLLSKQSPLLNHSSVQSSGALQQKDFVKYGFLNINSVSACASGTGSGPTNKKKTTEKLPSNNFPSNVKTLLSTGIFEGVPVKYISWSGEKNLKGAVKGTGYLCGCKECKLSKVINAYEFEKHAGCKTKHPNNHIYFENGKSIYAVVQELKSTPPDMLFATIENVFGSLVNQKNLHTWKDSYQATNLEIQRINGKDELDMHPK
ncbi:Hypothetical predicted protein [Olea europaea subsp. europaea]|uniref:Tify domain-containing protein n=1 Tax=Olea europaea subsp. europaea TaxID=158383 RepID=A0A8S0V6I6_OLEEU|nr:Hypothetical predicted protein [Olea europaea subsp. europaea]